MSILAAKSRPCKCGLMYVKVFIVNFLHRLFIVPIQTSLHWQPLLRISRGGVLGLEDALEDTFTHLKSLALASKVRSLALASKPQVLENCPVLSSRTAIFFESLKFCWKTPETSPKICKDLFVFLF